MSDIESRKPQDQPRGRPFVEGRSGNPPVPEKTFESEMRWLAQRYQEDCVIDFAKAPLASLLAWCLSQSYVSMRTAGNGSLLFRVEPKERTEPGEIDVNGFIGENQ